MRKKTSRAKTFSLDTISRYRGVMLGLAALWIAWYHSYMHFATVPVLGKASTAAAVLLNALRSHGNAGVDVFLLLSGLGLYYSFEKTPKVRAFYRKRAVRVLPPFLIVSVLWTGMDCTGGFGVFFKRVFLLDFFTEGNTTCWYVNLLLILYLLYPPVHCFLRKRGIWAACVLIVCSVAAAFAMRFLTSELYGNISLAVLRLPVFVCGAYIGKLSFEKKEISRLWLWAAGAVYAACWLVFLYLEFRQRTIDDEMVLFYLFCPFTVSGVLLGSAFFSRFSLARLQHVLAWFGGYSFEIYLLYEKTAMRCKSLFPVDDSMHVVYYIPVFVLTMLLSVALQAVCNYLTRTLLTPKKDGKP
ncbi:MAG: acyltransferase [Clostridia bacterium]|nr:acyltransferase [Clostridia bacterium]